MIPGSGISSGEGIGYSLQYSWASLVAQLVKNPPAMQETCVRSLGWEDPLEKGKEPTPVFWPGEFHGLYSPWDHKESDTTEKLSLLPSYSAIQQPNIRPVVHQNICLSIYPPFHLPSHHSFTYPIILYLSILPSFHSPIYPSNQPSVCETISPSNHLPILPCSQSPNCPSIHSSNLPSTYSTIHSPVHSFILPSMFVYPSIFSIVHPSHHQPFKHQPFTSSGNQSNHSLIYQIIHPFICPPLIHLVILDPGARHEAFATSLKTLPAHIP